VNYDDPAAAVHQHGLDADAGTVFAYVTSGI
jgi:hypothetical protein